MFNPPYKMTFQVMNRTDARRASFRTLPEHTVIISISDADQEPNKFAPNRNICGICRLYFDDVESGEPNCITESDAIKLRDFMCNHPNTQHVIVHCGAGVSRSAGTAAALMKIINDSDMDIFDNPRFCPNMTVYRTIINAFVANDPT